MPVRFKGDGYGYYAPVADKRLVRHPVDVHRPDEAALVRPYLVANNLTTDRVGYPCVKLDPAPGTTGRYRPDHDLAVATA